jgi:predicted permease
MPHLLNSLGMILQDVKLGVRILRKHLIVTCVAIVTLTLGIGVSAGIFALVNAFWLRPHVEKNPENFVRLYAYNDQPSFQFGQPGSISLEDYRVYEAAHSLVELAAWHQVRPFFGTAKPMPLRAAFVTCNFFSVYGLSKPQLGRLLLPEECSGEGPNSVAVISDEFWRTQLNADPRILGRTILLNKRPFTVVGVTPPHFSGRMSYRFSAWIPLLCPMAGQLEPDSSASADFIRDPSVQWLSVEGRRRTGYSLQAVQAELSLLAEHQDALHPGRKTSLFVTNGSALDEPGQRLRNEILVTLLVGALMLLVAIASANVASLLLARAASRRKEVAIRLSIGAGRPRLLQLLFTEAALLVFPAASMSMFLAYWLPRFLAVHLTENPLSIPLEPDWRVFCYVAAGTILAAVICSIAPALASVSSNFLPALNGQASISASGKGIWLTGNLLIGMQLAVSFVALTGAGIFVALYLSVLNGDPGFEVKQAIVVPLGTQGGHLTERSGSIFYRNIERRVLSLPGVESICFTDAPPFDGSPVEEFRFRGQAPGFGRTALVSTISVGCLRTLGIRSVSGRVFERSDLLASHSAPPAVVSQAFARSFWPQEIPIGKSVLDRSGTTLTVVGVVNDTESEDVGAEDGSRIYRLELNPRLGDTLIVRAKGDPNGIVGAVAEIIRGLDPDMIVIPRTLRSEIEEAATRMHGFITMMVVLAAGVVFLAVMGIYGVVWFAVSQRTKEMGIRIALGASKLNLIVQVIRSNTRPVISGQFAGLLLAITGSVALAKVSTDNRLFTNAPSPVVYVVTFLLLQVAALLAMLGPAIAAAWRDPVNALRQE